MVQPAARFRLPDLRRGTPDIFVHMETLRRFGMTELRPGQFVLVRFGPGSKGMMAAEIQPETGAPGLSSHYPPRPKSPDKTVSRMPKMASRGSVGGLVFATILRLGSAKIPSGGERR